MTAALRRRGCKASFTGTCSRVTDAPVTVVRHGDHVRAAVTGEFDMQATFTVEPQLERIVAEPDTAKLTLDLTGVSFIDSTGLGVVLRLHGEAQQRGIELAIVRGPLYVHRVFETAGLADTLPFEDPGQLAAGGS